MSTEFPNRKRQEESFINDEEKFLKGIAGFVLFLGIFSSVVILGRLTYDGEGGFQSFLLLVQILPASFVIWGVLRVLAKISINLHEINRKIKNSVKTDDNVW